MKMNFFEEFPVKRNLNKTKLIDFNSLLFIATRNLAEFRKHERYVRRINRKISVGYWPVLSKKEGYWLSPFSDTEALEKVIEELNAERRKLTILWDAEFPLNRVMLLSMTRFFKNKIMIDNFLRNTRHNVYTAEYVRLLFLDVFLGFCGMRFSYLKKRIFMVYTSGTNRLRRILHMWTIKKSPRIALGTIATGILGNEPVLTPENLDGDLKLAKDSRVKEVFIFRLGGLNERYMKIIKKYI